MLSDARCIRSQDEFRSDREMLDFDRRVGWGNFFSTNKKRKYKRNQLSCINIKSGPREQNLNRTCKESASLGGQLKLGIASWTLPWSIGIAGYPRPKHPLRAIDLLDKAVRAKVSVVQIADNFPLHELQTSELDELRKAAEARGLTLEVGTRGLDPEHLTRYIAVADRIGAKVLRTVLSGCLCDVQQLAAAEASIRDVVPLLERKGISLALENNEAFSAAEFAGIIRRIENPCVGICLDTANSLGRPESLETVVNRLSEFAVVLHAKDYDIQRIDTRMGFSVLGKPAGEGRVDFDWVLAQLRRNGRGDISVIVEHWPPFAGTIETTIQMEEDWLARSVKFLQSKVSTASPTVN
jgi:3-oxoisoapionate decarboxylase